MSFAEQPFERRFAAMGDEAEAKFLEMSGANAERFGMNRPNIYVGGLPAFIRYMPDYMQHHRLVECMGVGKDQTLKLKLDKLYALIQWDDIHPTFLFVWDRHDKTWTNQPIREVQKACLTHGEFGRFPEGTPIMLLDLKKPEWEWAVGT